MTDEGLPPAPSAAALLEAGYDAYAGLPLDLAAASASTLSADQAYEPVHWMQTGIASTYGGRFHGRLTASGERFNSRAMTAAHRVLKFGTRVRVTRVSNGLSVIVRVNDRGPYHGDRIVDLSTAAARALGMGVASVMLVTIEALPE